MVAMPAIDDDRDIDIGNVAILERAIAWNAMADDMIE